MRRGAQEANDDSRMAQARRIGEAVGTLAAALNRCMTEDDVRRIVREELARDLEERRAKLRSFVAEVHGSDRGEPITDSRCEYLFWPTGRCDKCGNVHNGKLPGVEPG